MTLPLAQWLVGAIGVYALLGLVFAVPFSLRGAQRIDPDAVGGSWGFRVLIIPGAAALWPMLLVRWLRGSPPPTESSPHRRAAEGAR